MQFQVLLKPSVQKQLDKFDIKTRKRLLVAIENLSTTPYMGKKLRGLLDGYYSYRVWPYRIIYAVIKDKLVVLVVSVGYRQGVYE